MSKKGFTLIELLTVVIIIGILAAVAIPQYTKTIEKSRGTEALAIVKQLAEQTKEAMMLNARDWETIRENLGKDSSTKLKNFTCGVDNLGSGNGHAYCTHLAGYYRLVISVKVPGKATEMYCQINAQQGDKIKQTGLEVCKGLGFTKNNVRDTATGLCTYNEDDYDDLTNGCFIVP